MHETEVILTVILYQPLTKLQLLNTTEYHGYQSVYWMNILYIASAECIFVTESLWECLGVVGPVSQCGQIPELTEPRQWPSCATGSAGKSSANT